MSTCGPESGCYSRPIGPVGAAPFLSMTASACKASCSSSTPGSPGATCPSTSASVRGGHLLAAPSPLDQAGVWDFLQSELHAQDESTGSQYASTVATSARRRAARAPAHRPSTATVPARSTPRLRRQPTRGDHDRWDIPVQALFDEQERHIVVGTLGPPDDQRIDRRPVPHLDPVAVTGQPGRMLITRSVTIRAVGPRSS